MPRIIHCDQCDFKGDDTQLLAPDCEICPKCGRSGLYEAEEKCLKPVSQLDTGGLDRAIAELEESEQMAVNSLLAKSVGIALFALVGAFFGMLALVEASDLNW